MSSQSHSKLHPIRQQAGRVRADVQELGGMARASAREVVGEIKERGGKALKKGRKKVMRAERGFEQHVSENPFRSVVIAAGIGALLGFALRRRS